MTAPSPDRAPDEIERKLDEISGALKVCFCNHGHPNLSFEDARWLLATLRETRRELAAIRGRRFPILGGMSIPWTVIEPFAGIAYQNHGQTLERLAERGGLAEHEALCVLNSCKWHSPEGKVVQKLTQTEAVLALRKLVAERLAALAARAGEPATRTEEPQ